MCLLCHYNIGKHTGVAVSRQDRVDNIQLEMRIASPSLHPLMVAILILKEDDESTSFNDSYLNSERG